MDLERNGFGRGDDVPVDAPEGASVLLLPDFDLPAHAARLRSEDGAGLLRMVQVWDPLEDRRVIPGHREFGSELWLELVGDVGDEEPQTGRVTLLCEDPGEICFNLADDDGDGAVDCADLHCARDEDCVDGQEDLETFEPDCAAGGDWTELEPPALGTLDDQRTLYRTFPEGEVGPWEEFRGGAELVIRRVEAAGTLTVQVDGAGLLCIGEDVPTTVDCGIREELPAGSSRSLELDGGLLAEPWFLEPEGAAWTGLRARLDCD